MGQHTPRYWSTPLLTIGGFVFLVEIVAGIAISNASGTAQNCLIAFVCIFPVLALGGFFWILYKKPHAFYPPSEFGSNQDVEKFAAAMNGLPSGSATEAKSATVNPATQSPFDQPKTDTGAPAPIQATELADESEDCGTKMIVALLDKKPEEAEKYHQLVLKKETNVQKKAEQEMWYQFLRFMHMGATDALEKLKKYIHDPSTKEEALDYLAYAYKQVKELDIAKDYFQQALQASPQKKEKYAARIADAELEFGDTQAALTRLLNALRESSDPAASDALYRSLANVYEKLDDHKSRALALEKVIAQNPLDADARFKAAWSYSQCGFHEIAIFHYSAVNGLKKEAAALNNLGVEYDHFKMPVRSIRSYRKAFEADNTLAAANIAFKYLDGGFIDEAREVIEKAKLMSDVHANVGSALVRLQNVEKEEEKTLEAVKKRAAALQRFMKDYASARLVPSGSSVVAGDWIRNDGIKISLTIDSGKVSGAYKEDETEYSVTGTVQNRAAEITLTPKPTSQVRAWWHGEPKEKKGWLYVTAQTMHWLLNEDEKQYAHTFSKETASS